LFTNGEERAGAAAQVAASEVGIPGSATVPDPGFVGVVAVDQNMRYCKKCSKTLLTRASVVIQASGDICMIESKGDVAELVDRVSSLNNKDFIVLKHLRSRGQISEVELAVDLRILPSEIHESVERLSNMGFVQQIVETPTKSLYAGSSIIKLSADGEEAVTLLPLVEKIRA
jgi:hypothetical protein